MACVLSYVTYYILAKRMTRERGSRTDHAEVVARTLHKNLSNIRAMAVAQRPLLLVNDVRVKNTIPLSLVQVDTDVGTDPLEAWITSKTLVIPAGFLSTSVVSMPSVISTNSY